MNENCPYHEDSSDINRGAMWKELNAVMQETVDTLVQEAATRRSEFPEFAANLSIVEVGSYAFRLGKDTHLLDGANGRFTRTIAAMPDVKHELSDLLPLYAPIAQDDTKNAIKTAASAAWIASLVEGDAVQEVISEQSTRHAGVIRTHTFLGMERKSSHEALHMNLQQAVTIVAGALRLLTAEVPADMIENTERRLVQEGRTEELARRIGSGAVSTLIRNAAYVESPLTEDDEFSPALEHYINRTRQVTKNNARRFREAESAAGRVDPMTHYLGGQGLPCPAIKGPVQMLSEALLATKYGTDMPELTY